MAPSMRTFSSFLFLVSLYTIKFTCRVFHCFPAYEVNAWIEATVRAAGTSTPKGHCGRLPTWCARSWAKSTRKHVPASHSNRSTCGCSRNATGWRPSRTVWRKLDEVDEAKLCRTLDRNAFATNRDLAAVVGNKISERSVSVLSSSRKTTLHSKGCSRSGT